MNKHLLRTAVLSCVFCLVSVVSKAQFVTIPDTAFVTWLQTNYPACMSGNQMDTTCSGILNAQNINCSARPIKNLYGIQYFKSMHWLDCSNDSLTAVPPLPASLWNLNCARNQITVIPTLPDSCAVLNCSYNQVTSISPLPVGIFGFNLVCSYNLLTSLPSLPATLTQLYCYSNSLTSLPALPATLTQLGCSLNSLSSLPTLPNGLIYLYCAGNHLSTLPALPASIITLDAGSQGTHLNVPALPDSLENLYLSNDFLTSLPALPAKVKYMFLNNNNITHLPVLPASMRSISIDYNLLDSLPALPTAMTTLICQVNRLTSMPALPDSLTQLWCGWNKLTSLPALPAGLLKLQCQRNYTLTSLPALPDTLTELIIDNDSALTCLPALHKIKTLNFTGTPIQCLPNYGTVTTSTPLLASVPICDIFNNPGCQAYWNISGAVYYDANNNCANDAGDVAQGYVKVLLDSAGIPVQQVFSSVGVYSFETGYGNFTVQTDTAALPFTINCPASGTYAVTVSGAAPQSFNNDFAFKCRQTGFDVGVQSIVNTSRVPRPGDTIVINTTAGDISALYGAHCATGVSGQVVLTFTGQATYIAPAAGALTPTTVSGNTITWNIADFGTVDVYTAFNLVFKIDNSAVAGTSLCVTATVTPTAGDYNTGNNSSSICFVIISSLDPNKKEVSPAGDISASQDWLTYTIHFQNTGTAEAQHIYVDDTLDTHVDPASFQMLASSHQAIVQLKENAVRFNFPNINLPDSNANEALSHGYVQYKVKLKNNLPVGTHINNTAFIYFDFNSAVVTNTTVNTITTTGISDSGLPTSDFRLFPNPATNSVTITVDETMLNSTLSIYDITGKKMTAVQLQSSVFGLPTSNFSSGIYFVTLENEKGRTTKKLMIESR